jgi:pSer/pThr/pTyr-binding forkhead associated (FHA) protein
MWKLVIEDDEGKRTVVPLTREQYSIGRKDGNTIRLTERNVSREHARLYKKANGAATPSPEKPTFVLEDLTSYNGVFVNGLRITHAQDLAHGDLVQIGDYRIVLQDESLLDTAAAATAADSKATMPQAPAARAQAASLLDRPNRLVMLAGPTPGAEFPLTDERMTVGRAEDASVSINHNSVSRLHCEIHSLGDGRFEIVDKGSSNGVRVNASDLRRGIIEPGDVIELGDVKFKFIGAGQVFRATESQQLALLNDRAAADVVRGRKRGSNALPVAIFAVVVAAGALGAWVYTRPKGENREAAPVAQVASPDQQALDDAKRKCAAGDCDGAHDELATISEGSPVRASQDFKDLMNRWADQTLARADAEQDSARKHALYQKVASDMAVDPARRKQAADRLQALDAVAAIPTATPLTLPQASSALPPDAVTTTRPDAGRRTALAPEPNYAPPPPPPQTVAAAPPLPPPTQPVVATPKPGGDDRERQAALQATTQDAKAALKAQLEQKVYSGRGTDTDIRLLIATCKELGDKMCVQQARQIQAQRQQ